MYHDRSMKRAKKNYKKYHKYQYLKLLKDNTSILTRKFEAARQYSAALIQNKTHYKEELIQYYWSYCPRIKKAPTQVEAWIISKNTGYEVR